MPYKQAPHKQAPLKLCNMQARTSTVQTSTAQALHKQARAQTLQKYAPHRTSNNSKQLYTISLIRAYAVLIRAYAVLDQEAHKEMGVLCCACKQAWDPIYFGTATPTSCCAVSAAAHVGCCQQHCHIFFKGQISHGHSSRGHHQGLLSAGPHGRACGACSIGMGADRIGTMALERSVGWSLR
eukprot:269300-Pelagomonas_calceolata.AAC.7